MPTYEYRCSSCEHEWEEQRSIKEEPTKICPECKKETAERKISACNFILKGGGWFNSGGY